MVNLLSANGAQMDDMRRRYALVAAPLSTEAIAQQRQNQAIIVADP